MQRTKKTEFVITDAAVSAFQQMVRYQLELWDASSDLERILKCEVESDVTSLAACFGEPDTTRKLTADDLRDWLEDHAGEPTAEEDE